MNYVRLSKEVSYALRHHPEEYELEMDKNGFVELELLLLSINEENRYEREVTKDDILHIIRTSDKKRFEINGNQIRALYGHTIDMKIQKEECMPPITLFHGTAHRFLDSIQKEGLKSMRRQYVHLSADISMAKQVGSRKDRHPIILKIDANQAYLDGIKFYKGNDRVWLCEALPSKYIHVMKG